MSRYEYAQLFFNIGDLDELNRLAAEGWRVIHAATKPEIDNYGTVVLLERSLPRRARTIELRQDWLAPIRDYVATKDTVTLSDVIRDALGKVPTLRDKVAAAAILKSMGWQLAWLSTRNSEGKRNKVYVRPPAKTIQK